MPGHLRACDRCSAQEGMGKRPLLAVARLVQSRCSQRCGALQWQACPGPHTHHVGVDDSAAHGGLLDDLLLWRVAAALLAGEQHGLDGDVQVAPPAAVHGPETAGPDRLQQLQLVLIL